MAVRRRILLTSANPKTPAFEAQFASDVVLSNAACHVIANAMLRVVFPFVGAFFLTLLVTPLIRRKAVWLDAFDHPGEERRVHQTPMPRLGGVAIYITFVLIWVVCAWWTSDWASGKALLLTATPVFLLGVLDDLRGVRERWKLLLPVASAAWLYWFGWGVMELSLWPGTIVPLPSWLGLVLTVLWLAGLTNAFNLIDGLDGLAVGVSSVATGAVWGCAWLMGQSEIALLSAMLLGALLGFLPYNFYPAKIFLGDSGSLFLGFVIAALALRGTAGEAGTVSLIAPILLGLPLTEAVVTLLRRWLAGQPLLPGDRGHFHHKLLELGYSQKSAVLRLYAAGGAFAMGGLLLLRASSWLTSVVLLVLALGVVWGVRSLRYAEFRSRLTRENERVG